MKEALFQTKVPTVELAGMLQAGVSPQAVREMRDAGMGLDAYGRLTDAELRELGWPRVDVHAFQHDDVWVVQAGEDGYPEELAKVSGAPVVLFGRGEKSAVRAGVAVIGTREMTKIGERVARAAVDGAQRAGVPVISGLAKGCDQAAHRAALDAGVPTVAVLACGVDECYPEEHEELRDAILAAGGAVVSEVPCGESVSAQRLMARNRIITGMSHVVVPCEAGPRSRGTLGAVGGAIAQGRFLVVGRVKPSWRHYDSAWLAERLSTGSQLERTGWSKAVVAKAERMQGAVANGVGDDAESVTELVEFAVLFARS
jgi:DNA protecting protein DprA